jgi:hypothetical protein
MSAGTKYAAYVNDAVMNGGRWNVCKMGVLVDPSRWFNNRNEHHSREYQVDIFESASTINTIASVTITG